MKRRLAGLAAVAAIAGVIPAATPVAAPVAVAKSCGGGYVHARINGAEKCLRRGQYCAHRADRQYHRYGYHCHKRDRNGDYHLT